jgi:drug/metabolite transporter (DMT)-like permease
MSADALALAAALCFGAAHFGNGLLARRADSVAVALAGQLGGTVLVLACAPWVAAPHVPLSALAWGALSGVGTGIGVAFLYRGMGHGRFGVVVPLSDVAAVALPVLTGVALLGDRPGPLAWCGIAVAPFALWLVSRSRGPSREDSQRDGPEQLCPDGARPDARDLPTGTSRGRTAGAASGVRDGLVAGVGFALQFVALSRTGPEAGLWPLVFSRLASVLAILPLAASRPARLLIPLRPAVLSLGAGSLGTVAIVLYTLAAWQQLLSLTVVLTALYPAVPVLLAMTVLRERLSRPQVAGLVCAGSSIALISLR